MRGRVWYFGFRCRAYGVGCLGFTDILFDATSVMNGPHHLAHQIDRRPVGLKVRLKA